VASSYQPICSVSFVSYHDRLKEKVAPSTVVHHDFPKRFIADTSCHQPVASWRFTNFSLLALFFGSSPSASSIRNVALQLASITYPFVVTLV
jgi:hypothetical protein